MTTAETDKPFKASEHRRERRQSKALLLTGAEPLPPKAYGDPWRSGKDGKQWLRRPDDGVMRK
ncbi:hypothetical protein [Azorhizobium caulinodans]|uniref:hypothetical protein n=1 Tax=Azorhizobium caulinodans TaxID=7 RepID=UPI002FBE133F